MLVKLDFHYSAEGYADAPTFYHEGTGTTISVAWDEAVQDYFNEHANETRSAGDYSVIPQDAEALRAWIKKYDVGVVLDSAATS